MNVAKLELCKELHELSGWEDTYFCYNTGNGRVMSVFDKPLHRDDFPAYDLGCLLRKLPANISDEDKEWDFTYWLTIGVVDVNTWVASYDCHDMSKFNTYSKTPEDAACKLAIELFKSGVLNNV